MEPSAFAKIEAAITRSDVRKLVEEGMIRKLHAKKECGVVPRKHARKTGKRKGKKLTRKGKKSDWFKIIRPQREMIKELKPEMQPKNYRKLYRMVKGNAFRSRAHLRSYLETNKIIKGEKK
jgi:large subunit ribosomal protein L19e